MTTALFDRILVPIASEDDAKATARALRIHLPSEDGTAILTNVIEKAGGVPDKASVEQREEYAESVFRTFAEEFDQADMIVEKRLTYGTDVAERIVETATEEDVSAIVFTPRGGSRWTKLLTGDVANKLIEESDRPVIVLPDSDDENGGDSE